MSPPNDRLDDIEFRYAHLERQVEQLDQVLLEHTRELDAARRSIKRLERELKTLRDGQEDEETDE